MSYIKELEIAKEAAVIAGAAIMDVYQNEKDFQTVIKADNSPLTIADRRANDAIMEILRKNFPDDAILSEEEKDNLIRLNNSRCFIVDPLDGTKEFLSKNGQFTVNIALSVEHRSVMGVIYVPAAQELYYAAKGMGAFYVKGDNAPITMRVSERTKENIRMTMSRSHACDEERQLIEKYGIKECIPLGSSLKGCMVARGDAEVYFRFGNTMEWDTAAMQCIVEEAGGVFRQMDDTEMLYNREDSLNSKGFYAVNNLQNRLTL